MKILRLIGVLMALAAVLSPLDGIAQSGNSFTLGSVQRLYPHKKVVFIPGIMGSRLDDKRGNLWGEIPVKSSRLILDDRSPETQASTLDAIHAGPANLSELAYGSYFSLQEKNLDVEEWLNIFSYDWRLSSEVNARKLNEFLCSNVILQGEPIVVIAHSMGGIVARIWLNDHYEKGCASGYKIKIDRLIFVAEPTYGAPKSIVTLLTGDIGLTWPIWERLAIPDMKTVGLSFDSVYELLPMQHSYRNKFVDENLCFGPSAPYSTDNPERFRVFHDKGGSQKTIVNVYSATTWFRFGLKKDITRLRDNYGVAMVDEKSYLQGKLDNANRVACKLADFQLPDELLSVTYFLGGILRKGSSVKPTTIAEVLISDNRLPSITAIPLEIRDPLLNQPKYVYYNLGPGDETVPEEIAIPNALERTRKDNLDHLGILNSPQLEDLATLLQKEASISLDSGREVVLNSLISAPIYDATLAFAGKNATSQELGEALESAKSEGIDFASLQSKWGDSGKTDYTTMPYYLKNSEILNRSMSSGYTNSIAIQTAKETGNPSDWHVVSLLSNISDLERGNAAYQAAIGYLAGGDANLASDMFEYSSQVYADVVKFGSEIDASNFENALLATKFLRDGPKGVTEPISVFQFPIEADDKSWVEFLEDIKVTSAYEKNFTVTFEGNNRPTLEQ